MSTIHIDLPLVIASTTEGTAGQLSECSAGIFTHAGSNRLLRIYDSKVNSGATTQQKIKRAMAKLSQIS